MRKYKAQIPLVGLGNLCERSSDSRGALVLLHSHYSLPSVREEMNEIFLELETAISPGSAGSNIPVSSHNNNVFMHEVLWTSTVLPKVCPLEWEVSMPLHSVHSFVHFLSMHKIIPKVSMLATAFKRKHFTFNLWRCSLLKSQKIPPTLKKQFLLVLVWHD